MRVNLLFFIGTLCSVAASAQCPIANFELSVTACREQNIYLENITTGGQAYSWDVCSGDLQFTPTANFVVSGSSFFRARVFRMVQSQNGLWYGFAIDQPNNTLVRFDFGNSPDNTPTVVSLGNPGSRLQNPLDIHFIQENTNWFALVANTSGNNLLRLNFGNDLASVPSVTDLGTFGGSLQAPGGVYTIEENGNVYAFVSNGSSSQVTTLNFGNSVLNSPTTSIVSIPGSSGLRGLSFIKECDRWFGIVTSYNTGALYYLDFQNGANQPPVVSQLNIPGSSYSFPASIKLVNEGGEFFAFVQSAFPAHVYRISFGESILDLTGTFTNLGNFGISNDNSVFELIGFNSSWRGFSIDLSGTVPGAGRLFRFNFPESCSTPVRTFEAEIPPSFTFSNEGLYRVTLEAKDAAGNLGYHSKTISIVSGISPDIDIASQDICSGHPVQFTSINASSNLVSYQWDFGDFNTSDQQDPDHVYATAGRYNVQLDVLGSNGCSNVVRKETRIFNEPLADFTLPGASPICTNQLYQFFNSTVYDAELNPSWEWSVNGAVASANFNFESIFNNPTSQTIKLAVSIPGCINEAEKLISSVTEGPLVNFSSSGQCQETPVSFTNTTTGAVNGYSWNFGDGQNSTDEDPLNSYGSPGTFDVTLTAFGTSGCNNTKTESATIYSKPQTDFSVALPPFSCSGTPTQFTDTTPNPFDSNLASWQWNFGDGTGSSTTRNPQYTFQNAGDYSVSLTATTNFGCSTTIQKPVTISPSPVANFTNSPPCLGVPINFTNTSTGLLQSQQWQIQSSFYTVANPVHAFLTSGDKNVTLNVTATNGCISSVTRTLNVPAVLIPDFSVSRNCINQQTEFTDITNDAADAVVGYAWNFAGLGNGTENPQVFSFANTGNFNVSLSVTTQTGCVHSAVKNVSIINSPQANFIATPSFGPPPLQVQFTNTSTNSTSYLWQFNDPNSSSSTSVSPSFTFSELGSYEVGLTAFNAQGCSTLFSRLIEVVIPFTDVALTQLELIETGQASVKPAVTIQNKSNIAITNLPLTFEVDGTAFRTFVATTIPPNSSYYHLSDFELPAPSSLSYVCALAEIEDTSPNDNQLCASVDQPIVVLAPYPNPATAQSHIEVQWIVRENRAMEVFLINSIGQMVYSESVNSVSGLNTFRLPATGFQTGLYFLLVRSGDFSRTHRLMVLE